MRFDDLKFEEFLNGIGIRATHTFPNGYGVSVIKSPYTYGGTSGLYELGVLWNDELTYDTPITSDVLGRLTPDDINKILVQVENVHKKMPYYYWLVVRTFFSNMWRFIRYAFK